MSFYKVDVEQHVQYYIDKYLDDEWSCEWYRSVYSLGFCDYTNKKIALNSYLLKDHSYETIHNTILHEIAHAIAGFSAGHGEKWKEVAIKIGLSDPQKFHRGKVIKNPKYVSYNSRFPDVYRGWYRMPSKKRLDQFKRNGIMFVKFEKYLSTIGVNHEFL